VTLALVPAAAPVVRTVRTHADGPSLNEALARTGLVQLAFCVVLSAAIMLA
jgi:1,4-dihydroxy-2-naphthoate octaprenyltransferase